RGWRSCPARRSARPATPVCPTRSGTTTWSRASTASPSSSLRADRMARVLVTEEIAPGGLDRLRAAGHDVDVQLGLDPDGLLAALPGAHALIIRSATKVTADVLAAGEDLI